jgi:YYY domain-containing protein
MSQIGMVVGWWLALQLFGLAALPLTLRLLRNLPDRGWAFARPLGLIATGYLFWLGGTLGFLANSWSSIVGVLLVVAAFSWLAGWREAVELPALLRSRRPQIVAVEVLFTAAFLAWVFVRAHDPAISGTEKPMELAFTNGVLRSEQFPPLDPWLSGYPISYYYFGYVIAGMLIRLTGIPAQFAFNLMLPTLFALTATGAFAIGASLSLAAPRARIVQGLLAAALVVCLTNLEPLLEVLNVRGALSPGARAFFQIKDMPTAVQGRGLFPDAEAGWWWWRATRVIGTPAGQSGGRAEDYTIHEFPFFSFIHADMHPHVLALPFVFLAIAFALNLLLTAEPLSLARLRRDLWTVVPVGVLFGALGFLNAWDLPTFVFVLFLAWAAQAAVSRGPLPTPRLSDALSVLALAVFGAAILMGRTALGMPDALRVLESGGIGESQLRVATALAAVGVAVPAYWLATRRAWAREAAGVLVGALLLGLLFYLPFYIAFRSQASGIMPVLVRTQWHHFLLVWGPLWAVAAAFLGTLLRESWAQTPPESWTRSRLVWGAVGLTSALLFVVQAPALGLTLPLLVAAVALADRYLVAPAVAAPILARVPAARPPRETVEIAGGALPLAWPREHLFALILTFTGLLLIFGCELVYINDLFHNRMNTVFKLYYQAWICLALAGSYALPYLYARLRGQLAGLVLLAGLAAVLVVAVVPAFAMLTGKTRGFGGSPTLDGLAFWARDDREGIEWLARNVEGAPVVVEASGPSYQQQFGRVSSMTGLPTLLGWPFHEQQWRGTFDEQARRQPDIDAIYGCRRVSGRCEPAPPDPRGLQQILDRYGVTYIYVGPSEREAYGQIDPNRFNSVADVAFRNSGVVIYRVRGR